MARQDTRRITVTVAGRPLGVFDTFEGGDMTSEDVKHARGGGLEEWSYGGRKTVENVTVSRDFDSDRDDINFLENQRGKRGNMTVTDQPLDEDYNPKGRARVYTGTLLRVAPGEADSNSGEVDMLELEMSANGRVG